MDVLDRVEEESRKTDAERRKEELIKVYRRLYPKMIKDFVHREDLMELIAKLNQILREQHQGSNEIALELKDSTAKSLVIPRGSADFDGSRVDADMRISSRSAIAARIF